MREGGRMDYINKEGKGADRERWKVSRRAGERRGREAGNKSGRRLVRN